MSANINCELVGMAFTLVLFVSIYREYRKGSPSERGFLMCLGTQILASLASVLRSAALIVPFGRMGILLCYTVYLALVMVPVLAWLMYTFALIMEDNGIYKRAHVMMIVTYIIYLLFVLFNMSRGYMFSVSAAGEYIERPLRNLPLIFSVVCAVSDVLLVLYKWKTINSRSLRWILFFLPFLMCIGLVIDLLGNDWLTVLPTYAAILFAAYMLIQNEHTQLVQEKNQQLIQTLVSAAQTDGMTGVYNRATTEQLIRNLISASEGNNCFLLIVDLDDLKKTNDSYGHSEGDRALVSMAHILKTHFRRTDVVGRLGGDEFCAFLFNISDEEAIRQSISELSKKLSAFIKREGDAEHCSMGGAFGVCGIDSFDKLYQQADTALYHVKRNGKNGFAFYSADLESNPSRDSER